MVKSKYLTTVALVLTVLAISTASVFAATGSTAPATTTAPTKAERLAKFQEMDAKFEEMKAKQEEILKAVLAGDYDTWYGLMTANGKTPKFLDVINKDNFAEFSKAHQLMQESRQIMTDLGVNKGTGMRIGGGMTHGGMMGGFGERTWKHSPDLYGITAK